jgi:DNA primase
MDIVDVVSDFVRLKRSGKNYRALSPFTSEKTPSFYVVPAKGIFKDFSSGKGGDAFVFIMEHEGLSYPETIRYLAKKYSVEVKEDKIRKLNDQSLSLRESLYLVMSFAKDQFVKNLFESEEGRGIGLSYFKERGFTDRTLEKFELGYALDQWTALEKLATTKGYSDEILEKAGLIIKNEKKVYDRFRGRVIFPVHNLSGKIIAFGARILSREKSEDQPKYINSPETEIYHKSSVLFGLYFGKNVIRQQDNCYLVEGYTDVISMHQAGVENVVAASGTSLTEEQVKLIRRFTDNVTILFDGDAAGIKAAIRGIDLILAGGLNVRTVLLPEGHDPDSYSKSVGSATLQQYLKEHATDFISFKANLFATEAAKDPIKKAESIREIVVSISKIPDSIKRAVYIQETASRLQVPESVLFNELNKLIISQRRLQNSEPVAPVIDHELIPVPAPEIRKSDPDAMVHQQERESIRLLLNYATHTIDDSTLVDILIHELEDVSFTNPTYKIIYEQLRDRWLEGQSIEINDFLEQAEPEIRNIITDLITQKYDTSDHWSQKYQIFFPKDTDLLEDLAFSNVNRMKFRIVQRMLRENLSKLKTAEQQGDLKKLDELMTVHIGLKEAERNLAEILGIVIAG